MTQKSVKIGLERLEKHGTYLGILVQFVWKTRHFGLKMRGFEPEIDLNDTKISENWPPIFRA